MQPLPRNPIRAGLVHVACCGTPLLALLVIATAAGKIAIIDTVAIAGVGAALALLAALWCRRQYSREIPDRSSPVREQHTTSAADTRDARR